MKRKQNYTIGRTRELLLSLDGVPLLSADIQYLPKSYKEVADILRYIAEKLELYEAAE